MKAWKTKSPAATFASQPRFHDSIFTFTCRALFISAHITLILKFEIGREQQRQQEKHSVDKQLTLFL
jgi:hypothetical protein